MIPVNNHGNAWTKCPSICLSRTFPTKTFHKKRRFEGNKGRCMQLFKGTASTSVEIKVLFHFLTTSGSNGVEKVPTNRSSGPCNRLCLDLIIIGQV